MSDNACLWCDAPCGAARLCAECQVVNDHPPFHCQAGLGHIPTLGDSCAECHYIAERKARRDAANAPILESLRAIRADLVQEIRDRRPWPGCDFGKAILGMALDGAIRKLGGEP